MEASISPASLVASTRFGDAHHKPCRHRVDNAEQVVSKAVGRGPPVTRPSRAGLHVSRLTILASRPGEAADRGGCMPAPCRENPHRQHPDHRARHPHSLSSISDWVRAMSSWCSSRVTCLGANPEKTTQQTDRDDSEINRAALGQQHKQVWIGNQRPQNQQGREASSLCRRGGRSRRLASRRTAQ